MFFSVIIQFCKNSSQHFPEKEVTVSLTPNGYADGLASYEGQDCFFLPEEIKMKLADFLSVLREKR